MKRKLIKRNKLFLGKLLKYARLNELRLSMAVSLFNQKSESVMIFRLGKRGLLKEDWNKITFDEGFASLPLVTRTGRIACYRMYFNKSELPPEHQDSWLDLFNDIESADDNFLIERSNVITGRKNIFDE